MRILITSDNHLGYKESDLILRDDSFVTFEEVLKIGNINKVDLILQVGDFFHENRPSRYCINRTINILRKNIVDENLSIKSDDNTVPTIPVYKVKIPMICIHGNHDDPSGINKISTLDILHSAGLIKYIGKSTEVCEYVQYNNVRIYGMGYTKTKNVNNFFKNLEYKDLSEDFFNILLVHQNRVPRNKDYLCPSVIPKEFRLLVFGHEHDPIIIKNEIMVLQCGSTVRTSLSEAENNNKYCYILEDNKKILNKIKLNSPRPFIMKDCNLQEENELIKFINNLLCEQANLQKNNIDNQQIPKRVKLTLDKEQNNLQKSNIISVMELHNSLVYPPKLPLLRLRVLTAKIFNFNKNKFSNLFKDKVSNASEIIKFIPPKKTKSELTTIVYQSQNITDIIVNHLKCTPLECIPEYKFIEHFNKDGSYVEMVEENMKNMIDNIIYDNCLIADLDSEIRKIKSELCKINLKEEQYKNKTVLNMKQDTKSIKSDDESECKEAFNCENNSMCNSIIYNKDSEIDGSTDYKALNDVDEISGVESMNSNDTIHDAFNSSNRANNTKSQSKALMSASFSEVEQNLIQTYPTQASKITAHSSKAIRKVINSNTVLSNMQTEEVSDLSKISCSMFTNELTDDIKQGQRNVTGNCTEDKPKHIKSMDTYNIKNLVSKPDSDLATNSPSFIYLQDEENKSPKTRRIYEESDSTDIIIDF